MWPVNDLARRRHGRRLIATRMCICACIACPLLSTALARGRRIQIMINENSYLIIILKNRCVRVCTSVDLVFFLSLLLLLIFYSLYIRRIENRRSDRVEEVSEALTKGIRSGFIRSVRESGLIIISFWGRSSRCGAAFGLATSQKSCRPRPLSDDRARRRHYV